MDPSRGYAVRDYIGKGREEPTFGGVELDCIARQQADRLRLREDKGAS